MTAKHIGLGVRFGGRCGVCGRHTGTRDFELAKTALYKRSDGKFCPVHPECAHGVVKNKIGGGVVYRSEPDYSIEVEVA